jgi:hypothetical protein
MENISTSSGNEDHTITTTAATNNNNSNNLAYLQLQAIRTFKYIRSKSENRHLIVYTTFLQM